MADDERAPCRDVVIVDDDEGIREAFKLALELGDYRVHTAADGREGLELLRGMRPPCVILLDLMMPDMDGWTFARRLREDPRYADVALLVVTAFGDRAEGIAEARAVLRKPISVATLLENVEEHCGAPG